MDFQIFRSINGFAAQTRWGQPFMADYSKYGIGLFALMLVVGLLLARKRSRPERWIAAVAWSGIAALVAFGVDQIISNLVKRPRPFVTHPAVLVLVNRSKDFSFPSDHVSVATAIAVGLVFVNRKLGIAAIFLAFLMAFSRIYVGVHYPGDVFASLIIATAVVLLGWRPAVALLQMVVALPLLNKLVMTGTSGSRTSRS